MTTPALKVDQLELRVFDERGPDPRVFGDDATFDDDETFSATGGGELDIWSGANVLTSLSLEQRLKSEIGVVDVELAGDLAVGAFEHGNQILVFAEHERTDGLEELGRLKVEDHDLVASPADIPIEAELEASSWLSQRLGDRRTTARVRDEPLSEAVERLVEPLQTANHEISVENNLDSNPTVSETFDAVPLNKAINRLTNADAVAVADGLTLRLEEIPETTSGDITDEDVLSGAGLRRTSDGPVTHLRVDGGTIGVRLPRAQDPTAGTFADLTDGAIRKRQLPVAVAELDRVELRTRQSGASGAVVAALQPDDGGAPVDPSNRDRDIARRRLDMSFVAEDGRTAFEFPDHSLAGRDPWLLVFYEGEATAGIEVGGVDENGTVVPAVPSVQARQPLVLEVADEDAADRYGRHDDRISDESISSFDEARRVGQRILNQRSSPAEEVTVRAAAAELFDIDLLDARDVSIVDLGLDGVATFEDDQTFDDDATFSSEAFVVSEVEDEIDSQQLRRTLTLSQPAGFEP